MVALSVQKINNSSQRQDYCYSKGSASKNLQNIPPRHTACFFLCYNAMHLPFQKTSKSPMRSGKVSGAIPYPLEPNKQEGLSVVEHQTQQLDPYRCFSSRPFFYISKDTSRFPVIGKPRISDSETLNVCAHVLRSLTSGESTLDVQSLGC